MSASFPPPPPPPPTWEPPPPPLADRGRGPGPLLAVLVAVVLVAAGAGAWFLLSDGIEAGGTDATGGLGCTAVKTYPSEGASHAFEPPPGGWSTTPATSGTHSPATYGGNPVIAASITPDAELLLVHNLEHAYVIAYYQPQGDAALPAVVRARLAALVTGEEKVLLAPYPQLPPGTSLALVAWTKMQTCPSLSAQDAGAVASMTQLFVKRFRGAGSAPEPLGP
jgi:Protein of unknown function (DUF3105)